MTNWPFNSWWWSWTGNLDGPWWVPRVREGANYCWISQDGCDMIVYSFMDILLHLGEKELPLLVSCCDLWFEADGPKSFLVWFYPESLGDKLKLTSVFQKIIFILPLWRWRPEIKIPHRARCSFWPWLAFACSDRNLPLNIISKTLRLESYSRLRSLEVEYPCCSYFSLYFSLLNSLVNSSL